jgi:hypothetical protein
VTVAHLKLRFAKQQDYKIAGHRKPRRQGCTMGSSYFHCSNLMRHARTGRRSGFISRHQGIGRGELAGLPQDGGNIGKAAPMRVIEANNAAIASLAERRQTLAKLPLVNRAREVLGSTIVLVSEFMSDMLDRSEETTLAIDRLKSAPCPLRAAVEKEFNPVEHDGRPRGRPAS